ncbi:MAG: hypothetical protein GY765_21035 [bacterium]|nr:hypothetical protein [bacterium]
MNSKTILKMTLLAVVLIFASIACSNQYTQVRIDTTRYDAVDFSKYDKIVYADVTLKAPPKDYDTQKDVRGFFIEDVGRIADKEIELLEMSETDEKIKLEKLKTQLKDSPKTLLITGTLTFNIKVRSKIKEVKSETGKRKKSFVNIHHWNMELEVVFLESGEWKEIFRKTYKEKTTEADREDTKYNFEKLFFKLTSRLVKKITTLKRQQRRYLLTN